MKFLWLLTIFGESPSISEGCGTLFYFQAIYAYLLKDFYEEILKQMRRMRRILATQPTTNMLGHAPAKNQVLAEKICFKFHLTTLMPVRVHVLYCII